MTLSLSPNMQALPSSGARRLRGVCRKSMICVVAKQAARNSEVSTLPCNLPHQSMARGGIEQVKDTQHGTTSSEILREIGIFKSRGSDGFSSWDGHVRRHFFFLGITTHTACQVMCEMIQVGAIGNFSRKRMAPSGCFLRQPQTRFRRLR
jgi:hypothetical protein